MKIKRYNIIPTHEGLTEDELDEEGEWVHIHDVQQLEKQLLEARTLLAKLLDEKTQLQTYAGFIDYWSKQGGA